MCESERINYWCFEQSNLESPNERALSIKYMIALLGLLLAALYLLMV